MANLRLLLLKLSVINYNPVRILKELEEPGQDTSKYDVFAPTVVRPKKPDLIRTSQNYISTETMPLEVGVMRQFTFSSRLQRMSVITRTLGSKNFDLYAKGAPEMIASLSRPETGGYY